MDGFNKTKLCTYVKINCLKWNRFDTENVYLWLTELFEIELLICKNGFDNKYSIIIDVS